MKKVSAETSSGKKSERFSRRRSEEFSTLLEDIFLKMKYGVEGEHDD